MFSFLKTKKERASRPGGKMAVIFLSLSLVLTLLLPLKPAQAQVGGFVTDVGNTIVNSAAWVWEKTSTVVWNAIQKAGSIAFQRTLSSALNKIAYDAANYIGSGGQGQKPLFVTMSLENYLKQAGDEAAGAFIESFVNNLNAPDQNMTCQNQYDTDVRTCADVFFDDAASYRYCISQADTAAVECAAKNANSSNVGNVTPSFNVCSPSSLEAKIRIGLGLVDQQRPQGPNCTASQMIKSWGDDINKKLASLRDDNYLQEFTSIFDPRSNDVGIYLLARADLSSQSNYKEEVTKSEFITNKGFLDVRDIAGAIQGVPGEAQREADAAARARQEALGKTTGDILIDSANIFLNQLYIAAFDNLLRNLAKQTGGSSSATLTDPGADPGAQKGEKAVKQVTTSLLQPKFGIRTDYDVLSSLAICPNPKNPGPDNCVVDDKFMQAITEKKTVAEAIADGYLHGDWQITAESYGSSYNSAYSLRNILILRKYRIVPTGWEKAARELVADPEKPKKATLSDLVSCFDPNDQYNSFSTDFLAERAWCVGLVDPNWVLKAPLNYCQKEGVGAQILSMNIIPAVAPASSTLSITRADDYCADNQTCIKEKDDGSCEAYGYCNSERRTWNFDTASCQPINNTCQSFSDAAGRRFSYLKNTLDYSDCNSNNSGCRQYALSGTYAASTQAVSWNGGIVRYLNKNLSACTKNNEGCTGLLRIKPTWGANLVMNSDFTNDSIGDSATAGKLNDWPIIGQATIVNASEEPGNASGKALKLSSSSGWSGVYSDNRNSLLPANFQIMGGQSYTLSADVYLAARGTSGTGVIMTIGAGTDSVSVGTDTLSSWQHLSATMPAGRSFNEPDFKVSAGAGAVFYLRNLKFEMSNWDTGYSSYGAFKFYERLLPPYLEKACYVDATSATKDYNLKSDAPTVCADYARKCNKDEVGCERYTSARDNFTIGAKTTDADYCPADCLGYDVYIARGSYFNIPVAENLIPAKATACSAAAAGCNEFTNLDALSQGGEQKEYYTRLKQCIKPSATACANFYSWEGTENGYQLKAYSLKKNGSQPAVTAPEVAADGSALCDAEIYRLSPSDPRYNADCREFYNAAGQVSYHLVSRTYTCSDNCRTYRMSEKNEGNVCLNGGVWDTAAQACIYQAIPGEGQSCRAEESGCREYNGNNGSNVRLAASYDFETGLGGWFSPVAGALQLSNIANNKDGHSIKIPAQVPIELPVSHFVRSGSAYSLKFLARSGVEADLQISLQNPATGATANFSTVKVKGGNEWGIYQANLFNLDHPVGQPTAGYPNGEVMFVSANADFYLDDIVLMESGISDRYYLIRNSSQTPEACYYDTQNQYQGPDYNLGCTQYTDRNQLKHNLHGFTRLCSDSAVGCEQMIDTKNYSPYGAAFWEKGVATSSCNVADADCVKVEGDSAVYAVYDSGKLCSAANQGCSRLGEGQGGANFTGWADVFKNNNPDQYNTILCSQANVGCEEWKNVDDNTASYFKNPGAAACAYRVSTNPGVIGKRWFKIPVKRCDLDGSGKIESDEGLGQICTSDSNCGARKCLIDNNDYECPVTYSKTIGFGGTGNQVPTPAGNAGQCEASFSGCTEYIDPVTRFAPNLVMNPSYELIEDNLDGWGAASKEKWNGAVPASGQQAIRLEPYKLYSAVVTNGSSASPTRLVFLNVVNRLGDNNLFGAATTSLEIVSSQPAIFNAMNNRAVLIQGGAAGKTISVKELAINYQLLKNVDKTSCQGQTKFDNGCILFNERAVDGAAPASLTADAYATTDGTTPALCSTAGSCTANRLVKVRPDRVCASWLDCISYTQDPVSKKKTCYAFGECDRLDDKGECANFLSPNPDSAIFTLDPKIDQNATGYSLADQYNLSDMKLDGRSLDTDFKYDFETYPSACASSGQYGCTINSPDLATKFGTDYPANGSAYLKVGPKVGEAGYLLAEDISVRFSDTEEYYLNYLVSTKDSAGAFARITITDQLGSVTSTDVRADTGWQRKTEKLKLGVGKKDLKIELSAYSNTVPGPVYFDDISITPILKVSNTVFAAPECRLYPSTTSLSCENKNKNVIAEGLKGYCLEHDPLNPNVCLLWYPMDNIPVSTPSSLGYNGNFPLNYCTEVSGNFDIVEKRVGFLQQEFMRDDISLSGSSCVGEEKIGDNDSEGSYCVKTSGQCYGTAHGDSNISITPCPAGYNLWISKKWCPGNCDDNNYFKIICVPNGGDLLLKETETATHEQSANGGDWAECQSDPYPVGYGIFNGFHGYESSQKPKLMVYDYNDVPASASELKAIPGLSEGVIGEAKYFNFNCTRLSPTVEASGANHAWVERVKENSGSTLKSPFFKSDYPQNLADTPFGAASQGQTAGNGKISLRDLSNKNDPVYAGRPYGCVNGIGKNCDLIGACSGDSSIYCLATSTTGLNLGQTTCGSYGTCQALWTPSAASYTNPSAKTILKNIFLSVKDALVLNSDGKYELDPSANFDFSRNGSGSEKIPLCVEETRPSRSSSYAETEDSFCAILPQLTNIKLYFNDSRIGSDTNPYNIEQKGIYRLEFNSLIDSEQQPLKKIYIDWGDGYTQVVTNEDHRPTIGAPHVFYHYYYQTGEKTITVAVTDNWGFYKCNQNSCAQCNQSNCSN
ncbi:MAG: hypothetical protein WC456_00405 [Patescibacteria group bacterium]